MVCIKPVMHIMDKQVVRSPRRRREHSAEFTRELVARSLERGVSVAAIAMDSGINANLLFGWRRRHLESLAQAEPARSRLPAAVLLPVAIEAGPREIHCAPPAPSARSSSGTIEIEIGSARVLPDLLHGACEVIKGYANDELKARHLPKIVSGEWLAAIALTEPQAFDFERSLKTVLHSLAQSRGGAVW